MFEELVGLVYSRLLNEPWVEPYSSVVVATLRMEREL
jgi:hypothetical protein